MGVGTSFRFGEWCFGGFCLGCGGFWSADCIHGVEVLYRMHVQQAETLFYPLILNVFVGLLV